MIFGYKVPPEKLAQALRFPDQNFAPGVVLYLGICICTAIVAYIDTNSLLVLGWLALVIICWIATTVIYLSKREALINAPHAHAKLALMNVICTSLVFTLLIVLIVPTSSITLAVFMLCVVVLISVGTAAFSAPYSPLFAAMTYPQFLALIVTYLLRDDLLSQWLGFSSILVVVVLSWFNIMISNSILKMLAANDENEALTRKLRTALVQTDEANRAKSVFLASASHDLRQPLHALGLLLETMGGTELNRQQREIQNHMDAAIDSTQTMLDALLNISKLDAGAISSDPRPFLVQTIFSKLEAELAPTADEHNLIYRTRETIAAAYADPLIVELILRNLIANAIRYTEEGGLLVACRKRDGRLSIEVWDTGIGVPENKREDMFREFKQLDNPERDSRKGFGLGLAIAQGLAKTLDSEITVHSVVGQGSVFRFSLRQSRADVIDDVPKNRKAVSFAGTTVLVIDDDERVRTAMLQVLNNWGCRSIDGESAEEVLQSMQKQNIEVSEIDLALVDYRLRHGRTGKDAIEALRAAIDPKLPAIIITGDTATERISEARAVDALLIHKPASVRQLSSMMQTLLRKRLD